MPDQNADNKPVDPKSFLLPKKEGPSVDSAQRINAGALLASEQGATLPKPAPVPQPQTQPEAHKDDLLVRNLETYQGDIESVVHKEGTSVVSIAAAEADRRAGQAPAAAPAAGISLTRRVLYAGGGVLLIALAGVAAWVVYSRPTTVPVTQLQTGAPFIAVDDTVPVSVAARPTRDTLMQALDVARQGAQLSLGLVERLYVGISGSDTGGAALQEMPVQTLLQTLAPHAPQELLRTLSPQYVLGVHSFDENQAFLILSSDSYETAYAAMLNWEPRMQEDLLPLFLRTPPVHANGTATTSASTTEGVILSSFVDRVVENHDSRVVQNEFDDILLMWTFLDRNTIVITTNEFTLREIISRRTSAASLGLPQ